MSTLWLNTCVAAWGWMAQVAPAVTPGAATPATTAATPAAAATGTATTAATGAATTTAATTAATAATAPATSAPISLPGGATATPLQSLGTHIVTEPHTSMAMTVFHGAALFVYFLLCVALILCVMFQTSKNEGLAGMMGGSSSSALFRGKKSGEETLGMWTGRLAVAYILASFFIWLIFGRGGA